MTAPATEGRKTDLRLWVRLLRCASLIEREVRTRFRTEFDSTLPRFDILAQLDRAADGLSMGELSERLLVSNGNVTGVVNRLAAQGYVIRSASPRDRRSQLVKLSPAGRRHFDTMRRAHESWIEELLGPLSETEKGALLTHLDGLRRSLTDTRTDERTT